MSLQGKLILNGADYSPLTLMVLVSSSLFQAMVYTETKVLVELSRIVVLSLLANTTS